MFKTKYIKLLKMKRGKRCSHSGRKQLQDPHHCKRREERRTFKDKETILRYTLGHWEEEENV
jgi:hypothetical protein